MSSPSKETEEPTSSSDVAAASTSTAEPEASVRPPAKRRISSTGVIEISDTESDDSDICAVTSYQASADEVKRIRGEDYSNSSSSSSSSDYSSDSESPWEDDSILLDDVKSQVKVAPAQLNPRANRMDEPKLNPALKEQELIDKLTTHWKEQKDLVNEDIAFTCEPFKLCLLNELLLNTEIINNIIDDMNTLDWTRKKMDLYDFNLTADLSSLTWQRGIKGIYELLKTEVKSWVSQITGLDLTSVSASCSLYGPGDHLLVHDDRLGDRRVAFILYLAPWRPRSQGVTENGARDHVDIDQVDLHAHGWSEDMGGSLELFSKDDKGRPHKVVKKVYPRNNMLAFFQVGRDSFHQVSEVISLELPRLSINGWFHGPAPTREPEEERPASPLPAPTRPHSDVVFLAQWVEGAYMVARNRLQIQAQVEQDSEVCLKDFLQKDKLQALLDELRKPDLPWQDAGPADFYHYQRLPSSWTEKEPSEPSKPQEPSQPSESNQPPEPSEPLEPSQPQLPSKPKEPEANPIKAALRLWSSNTFIKMLADCTDLPLHTYSNLELQKWQPGDYTLLPSKEHYQESRLETLLFLGVPDRTLCGGSRSYVAPEEEGDTNGALVTVPPTNNALNLVYCDSGSVGFTKYLSKFNKEHMNCFYVLTCTYRE